MLHHVIRPRILAAVLLAICSLPSAGCAGSSQASEQPAADGRALFGQACAKCHGEDGGGGLPTAVNGPRPIDLRQTSWQQSRTDAEIVATVRDGRGAMPPFEGVLTHEQIQAVTAHVRQLAR